jgi:hypothetical protein
MVVIVVVVIVIVVVAGHGGEDTQKPGYVETAQAGSAVDTPSTVRPRFQTGVRYRPNEIFSVDVIFGHNIMGEGASWLTIGTTIRFPVEGAQPEHKRTGHL